MMEEFNNLDEFISKGEKFFSVKASTKSQQYEFRHPTTSNNKLLKAKFA